VAPKYGPAKWPIALRQVRDKPPVASIRRFASKFFGFAERQFEGAIGAAVPRSPRAGSG